MWLDAACLAPCMLLYEDFEGSLADTHYSDWRLLWDLELLFSGLIQILVILPMNNKNICFFVSYKRFC